MRNRLKDATESRRGINQREKKALGFRRLSISEYRSLRGKCPRLESQVVQVEAGIEWIEGTR